MLKSVRHKLAWLHYLSKICPSNEIKYVLKIRTLVSNEKFEVKKLGMIYLQFKVSHFMPNNSLQSMAQTTSKFFYKFKT